MSLILEADNTGQAEAADALTAGMADARAKGTKAILRGGTYKVSKSVVQPADLIVEGEGAAYTAIRPQSFAAPAPAWIMGARSELRDAQVRGPNARVMGQRTQGGIDGIRIDGRAKLTNVTAQNCDNGVVFNAPEGHITLRDCTIGNCFYGVYQKIGNGDHLIEGGEINGNAFADFAIPGNVIAEGVTFLRVHMGFAPYSLYHEKHDTPSAMLNSCDFIQVKFEAQGNGVIYDENWGTPARAGMSGSSFSGCYHSWSPPAWPGFRLPDREWTHAIKVGYVDRSNLLFLGTAGGFAPGSSGEWLYVNENYASWLILGEVGGNTGIKVAKGHPEFMVRLQANGSRMGWN